MMSSATRLSGGNAPRFSVFSDENDTITRASSTSSRSSIGSGSSSSLPLPSKRIKMASSSSSSSTSTSTKSATGLYAQSSSTKTSTSVPVSKTRPALATKSITVLADKENIDPLGRRKPSNGKEKLKVKSNTPSNLPSKTDLWKGKQPFDFASPEKMNSTTIKGSKTTVSTKYIYDMPGVEAIQTHVTSSSTHPSSVSSIADTKESKASSLRMIGVGSGSAISRPNKKNRPIPAPLKPSNGFRIFRDEDPTTSSFQDEGDTFVAPRAGPSKTLPKRLASEVSQMDTMRSPVASLQAADRRARELTESPLADVTLAYTGRGRFSNSPTADSGFGSRDNSVSPLPSARILSTSSSHLSNSPLQAYQEVCLPNDSFEKEQDNAADLSNALMRDLTISSDGKVASSSPPSKRRISQLSASSRSAGRSSSSSSSAYMGGVDGRTDNSINMHHINEDTEVALRAFEAQHIEVVEGLDQSEDEQGANLETEEEEQQDTSSIQPVVTTLKPVLPPSQTRISASQSRFGARVSAPTRKPLNMRI